MASMCTYWCHGPGSHGARIRNCSGAGPQRRSFGGDRAAVGEAVQPTAGISLEDLLQRCEAAALETKEEEGETEIARRKRLANEAADGESLVALVARVEQYLADLGFVPSEEQIAAKRTRHGAPAADPAGQEDAEGAGVSQPPSKKPRVLASTFVSDPGKTALANFHELCSHMGILKKSVETSPKIISAAEPGFRCTVRVALGSGESREFRSLEAHGKNKLAEHDAAGVALKELLASH